MKKNIIKIFIIIAIAIISIYNISYGFTINDLTGDTSNLGELETTGNSIINVIAIIGSAASIIFLIILGIKYMLGSVEEKATYKKSLLPYVIGAIFVFGASVIASAIYGAVNPKPEKQEQTKTSYITYINSRF